MTSSHRPQPGGASAALPYGWSRRNGAGRPRLTCLLTTLHPERALSNALVQHLSQELPDMRFTLRSQAPDVVWVCGFEQGREDLVQGLRARYPEAFLVVTGRGSTEGWGERVSEAGADFTCGWPLPVQDLKRILYPVRR